MKKILYLFLPVSLLLLVLPACKDEVCGTCEEVHWSYYGEHGADHWDKVCTDYAPCGGQAQSPVDISGAVVDSTLMPLQTSYAASETNIYNNGHTLQYNYSSGSSLRLDTLTYDLVQFHFHAGSEHSVDGNRHPAEVHLVHKNAVTGALAVIGIMIKHGDENPVLNQLFEKLPKEEGQYYRSSKKFNIADLLPTNTKYYTYSGSLTTPPCSEIVNWFVMEEAITASHLQIEKMIDLFYNNARPLQELNGRVVRMTK